MGPCARYPLPPADRVSMSLALSANLEVGGTTGDIQGLPSVRRFVPVCRIPSLRQDAHGSSPTGTGMDWKPGACIASRREDPHTLEEAGKMFRVGTADHIAPTGGLPRMARGWRVLRGVVGDWFRSPHPVAPGQPVSQSYSAAVNGRASHWASGRIGVGCPKDNSPAFVLPVCFRIRTL